MRRFPGIRLRRGHDECPGAPALEIEARKRLRLMAGEVDRAEVDLPALEARFCEEVVQWRRRGAGLLSRHDDDVARSTAAQRPGERGNRRYERASPPVAVEGERRRADDGIRRTDLDVRAALDVAERPPEHDVLEAVRVGDEHGCLARQGARLDDRTPCARHFEVAASPRPTTIQRLACALDCSRHVPPPWWRSRRSRSRRPSSSRTAGRTRRRTTHSCGRSRRAPPRSTPARRSTRRTSTASTTRRRHPGSRCSRCRGTGRCVRPDSRTDHPGPRPPIGTVSGS